jgi:hypothetical protein
MPLSVNEQKNIVADELVKLVAEYAEKFTHPEIPSGEARQWISGWMNYLPVSPSGWDDRLGKRSFAGRR